MWRKEKVFGAKTRKHLQAPEIEMSLGTMTRERVDYDKAGEVDSE